MEKNLLLTIEYDGTNFHGWQRQKGVRTVQGVLEDALSKICGTEVTIHGTSRTDAGVHALGQRATLQGDFGIPSEKIPFAANNLLAGGMNRRGKCADVRILQACEMPPGFHARFDSKGKTYRYIIKNGKAPDIFARNYSYQVPGSLDIKAMEKGAALIKGTHDFACFQAAGGTPRETTVRTIYSLAVLPQESGDIHLEITGDGFLYNMVRIITGTLVEIGQGKKSPEEIPLMLRSGDRQLAGHTAPAEGLYLVEIYYEDITKERQ